MELGKLIEAAVKIRASDIHLMEGSPPSFRVNDALRPVDLPAMTREDMRRILEHILPDRLRGRLEEKRGVDIGYQYRDLVRCRVIVFFERHRLDVVLRLIPMEIPSIETLELPPVVREFAAYPRGLVLVTGPTGCGKTTTLAAILDDINQRERVSIITIEDPIEYVYENKKAMVSQREVGDDIEDFNSGLTQALRQDPDVILVGEMRDMETMRTAIRAAETGHLVFSTLHTTSAVQTIERIISTFPKGEQDLLYEELGANLKAVITQELLRRADGHGRIAALEILVVTDFVAKLIREQRTSEIYEIMKGNRDGMQTLDRALADLAHAKKITEEAGKVICRDAATFHRYVIGRMSSGDLGGVG